MSTSQLSFGFYSQEQRIRLEGLYLAIPLNSFILSQSAFNITLSISIPF